MEGMRAVTILPWRHPKAGMLEADFVGTYPTESETGTKIVLFRLRWRGILRSGWLIAFVPIAVEQVSLDVSVWEPIRVYLVTDSETFMVDPADDWTVRKVQAGIVSGTVVR